MREIPVSQVTDTVERGERSAEIVERIRQSSVPALSLIHI